MITNKDCWVRERCKKAKNCDEEFCIKLFKILLSNFRQLVRQIVDNRKIFQKVLTFDLKFANI